MQAMLYATGTIVEDEDFNKAMVGIGSVWYALHNYDAFSVR